MTTKPQIIMWDSCVVIDYLKKTPDRFPLIQPMVEEAESGKLKIVVSEIVPAEVLTLEKGLDDLTPEQIAEHAGLIEDFFDRSFMIRRVVDKPISYLAAQMRRQYPPLKTCDAVILATAIVHRVPTLYTFDGDDADKKPRNGKLIALDDKIALGENCPNLKIKAPDGRADGQVSMNDIVTDDVDE